MSIQEDIRPVRFSIDYPDRPLNRLTTAFRIFVAIPILVVLAAVSGGTWQWTHGEGSTAVAAGAGGLLFFGPLLMILFRQKYPRWWFDWNLELQRFSNRVWAYLVLMDDRYPSTTDQQSVHLDYDYPEVPRDLNRWLPLVKWFLAIPHYIVLVVLNIAAAVGVMIAWFPHVAPVRARVKVGAIIHVAMKVGCAASCPGGGLETHGGAAHSTQKVYAS
jgi:hypothetical protein